MKIKRHNKKDEQQVKGRADFSDLNIVANADSSGSAYNREGLSQPLSATFTSKSPHSAGYPFPITDPDLSIHPAQLLDDVTASQSGSAATTPYDFITNNLPTVSPEGPLDPAIRSSRSIPGWRGNDNGRVSSQQTMIEIDKLLKREDTSNDFVPPRQAMNSDESDFDWDEDINFDKNGQVYNKMKEKSRSRWRQLSPFVRMVILIIAVAPILVLPAILVETLMHTVIETDPDQDVEARNQLRRVRKEAVVTIFTWLAFMWCVTCITNWGIDFIPQLLVRFCSIFAPSKVETFKSQMLIFVATKKYVKWLLDACWAVGSFAILTIVIFPLVSQQSWQTTLIKVLGALVVLFALILAEKILLQIISQNFHKIAYADRIKENKYALSVLDRLGTSRKNVKRTKNHGQYNRTPVSDSGGELSFSSANCRSRLQSRFNSWDNVTTEINSASSNTAWPTNEKDPFPLDAALAGAERPRSFSTTLPTSVKRHQRNMFKGLNRKLHGLTRADEVPTKDINSTENAKRLARMLFHNLQGHGEELVVKDYYNYFDTEEEAQRAFALFDKDGNGDISKREMKEKTFYVHKERKDLHTSVRDLSQAVGKLDIIFLTIVAVIWLLIILSIFGTSVVQNMLSIGSFLVALSFVFGNSLRTLFENIVFLFITHPYDSGDLCDIDGNFMYVREVGLNSTMFVSWDGKRIYYPNNVLSQKAINNIRRSPNMSEKIVLHVDVYTPQAKILELRARMREYLSKETKEFSPDMEIQIQEIDVKLKISMVIEHKGNWQDSGRRWARRTKFHYALKEAMEDIGIRYYSVPHRMEILQVDSCGSSSSSGMTMHSDGSNGGGGG